MSTEEKVVFRKQTERKWENSNKQVSIASMGYFIEAEEEIEQEDKVEPYFSKQKNMAAVRETAGALQHKFQDKAKSIQPTITGRGEINKDKEAEPYVKPKQNKYALCSDTSRKRTSTDRTQITLEEKLGRSKTKGKESRGGKHKGQTNTRKKKQPKKWKAYRGNHDEVCNECDLGGMIIECHTCSRCYHEKCDNTMPPEVTKSGVIWRCRECVQEHGETGHTQSTMKVQEPTSDHKRRRTCLESMRRVREGGKDQWAEYAAFEGDRHDRGKNGEPEMAVENVQQHIRNFIHCDIKGKIIWVLGDGHCLRRAIGKVYRISPGEVIEQIRRKCTRMLASKQKMYIESDTEWYKTCVNRPAKWDKIQESVKQTQISREEWGGNNEIQIWANISATYITVIDNDLDSAMTYHPGEDHQMGKNCNRKNRDKLPTRIDRIETNVDELYTQHIQLFRKGARQRYLLIGNSGTHYNAIEMTGQQTREGEMEPEPEANKPEEQDTPHQAQQENGIQTKQREVQKHGQEAKQSGSRKSGSGVGQVSIDLTSEEDKKSEKGSVPQKQEEAQEQTTEQTQSRGKTRKRKKDQTGGREQPKSRKEQRQQSQMNITTGNITADKAKQKKRKQATQDTEQKPDAGNKKGKHLHTKQ